MKPFSTVDPMMYKTGACGAVAVALIAFTLGAFISKGCPRFFAEQKQPSVLTKSARFHTTDELRASEFASAWLQNTVQTSFDIKYSEQNVPANLGMYDILSYTIQSAKFPRKTHFVFSERLLETTQLPDKDFEIRFRGYVAALEAQQPFFDFEIGIVLKKDSEDFKVIGLTVFKADRLVTFIERSTNDRNLVISSASIANLKLGQAKLKERKNEEALKLFKNVLNENKKIAVAYYYQAVANYELYKFSEALDSLDTALNLSPRFVKAYSLRAEIKYRWQYDKAAILSDYTKAIAVDPTNEMSYVSRGNFNCYRDSQQAFHDFETALQMDPRRSEAYIGRASLFKALHEYDKALWDTDTAVLYEPESATAHSARGDMLDSRESAIREYNTAIELAPTSSDVWMSRAQYYYKIADFDAALRDYETASRVNAKDAGQHFIRALLLSRLKRHKEAELALTQAMQLATKKSSIAEFRSYRSGERMALDDKEGALTDCNARIKEDSENAGAYHQRAEVFQHFKDYESALSDYSTALKLEKDRCALLSSRYTDRARLYMLMGFSNLALKDYDQAILLKPKKTHGNGVDDLFNDKVEQNYLDRSLIRLSTGELSGGLKDLQEFVIAFLH